jgi:hypothetical protein
MTIKSEQVERAVAEVSSGAGDPQHVATVVGTFLRRQPLVGHYVQSFQRELGLEGVVLALLHAHVVARCVEIAGGRPLRKLSAPDLDAASRAAEPLAELEPELERYLVGNITVEDATLGPHREAALRILRLVGRAFAQQL